MQVLSVELFASWVLVHEKYFLDQIIHSSFRCNINRLQPSVRKQRLKGRPRLRWEDDVNEEMEREGAREEPMERDN
jgi:hypothetical protein